MSNILRFFLLFSKIFYIFVSSRGEMVAETDFEKENARKKEKIKSVVLL